MVGNEVEIADDRDGRGHRRTDDGWREAGRGFEQVESGGSGQEAMKRLPERVNCNCDGPTAETVFSERLLAGLGSASAVEAGSFSTGSSDAAGGSGWRRSKFARGGRAGG